MVLFSESNRAGAAGVVTLSAAIPGIDVCNGEGAVGSLVGGIGGDGGETEEGETEVKSRFVVSATDMVMGGGWGGGAAVIVTWAVGGDNGADGGTRAIFGFDRGEEGR
ncbi:hypothetical protein W02_37900 [Nitrospira sp. KM1]|nr:hypothetical protein W02_37900 [Nitrospira sp. KM1]